MSGKSAREAGTAGNHRLELLGDLRCGHRPENGVDCRLGRGRFRADQIEQEVKSRQLPGQTDGGKRPAKRFDRRLRRRGDGVPPARQSALQSGACQSCRAA